METLLYAHEPHQLRNLATLLKDCGYGAPGLAASEQELRSALEHSVPELLVVVHSPGSTDATELIKMVSKNFSIPAIMAASGIDATLAAKAASAGYSSIIPIPASGSAAHAAIAIAMEHGKKLSLLSRRVDELESRLAERKIIEKAKGILMHLENISEEEAFRIMRRRSMSSRISMAKLAEELITSCDRPGLP